MAWRVPFPVMPDPIGHLMPLLSFRASEASREISYLVINQLNP